MQGRKLAIAVAIAVLMLATVGTAGAAEYEGSRVRVEVRVWQSTGNGLDIHIGARSATGSWRELGMVPLTLDDGLSVSGRYRFGDTTLPVTLPHSASPENVELRLWQDVADSERLYISARSANGSWDTLGTVRLLLDDGFSGDGRFRFGDIGLQVPLSGQVLSLAGRAGVRGFRDGQGVGAGFGRLEETALGLAVDRDGSVVVADFRNHAIRRVLPDGTVTTVAGGNGSGTLDGPAETARFDGPSDVAIDPRGAIYVADCWSHRIRRITPDGMVTTVAGGDHPENKSWLRRDGPADEALFLSPCGVALSPDGDLYIREQTQIRRLSPSGWVSTFAGDGGQIHKDGAKEHVGFGSIHDIEVDADGNVYVLDWNAYVPGREGTHYLVRKINVSGQVSTIFRGKPTCAGGQLAGPKGLAVTPQGEVYLTNTGRHQIVRVLGTNDLLAVAGTGQDGHFDGARAEAAFSEPGALALSPGGALVVMDQADSVVRIVLPEADGSFPSTRLAEFSIPRLEGVGVGVFAGRGVHGLVDGPAREALFTSPGGLALAADGSVIVADTDNHAIRRISPSGLVSTLAGGNEPGLRDGPAGEAQFSYPNDVAVGGDGTIYVTDTGNGLIRRLAPDGAVETIEIGRAPFSTPQGLALDAEGNLLFHESTRQHGWQLFRLSPTGELSYALDEPTFLSNAFVLDETGTLFFATNFATNEGRRTSIRKVGEDGTVSTVFEDNPTIYGKLFSWDVSALALSPDGTLYAADRRYGRVIKITPDGTAVIVVDRDSLKSPHFEPARMLITPGGDLLVADTYTYVIWKITLPGDDDKPARDVGALLDQIVDSLRRVPAVDEDGPQ